MLFWSETLTYSLPQEFLQQKFLISIHNRQPSDEDCRLSLNNVCGGRNGEQVVIEFVQFHVKIITVTS